jgi:hypothetical protein
LLSGRAPVSQAGKRPFGAEEEVETLRVNSTQNRTIEE